MHSHVLPHLGFSVMGSPNSVHEYLLCTPIAAAAAVKKTFAGTECPADGSAKAKTQTTSSIPKEYSTGRGSQKVGVPDSLDAFVLRRTLVYSKEREDPGRTENRNQRGLLYL